MVFFSRSNLGNCLSAIALCGVAVGTLFLTSCGGDRATSGSRPAWAIDATDGGKRVAQYGVAEKMLAGESAQTERAVLDARNKIAASMSSKIQSVTKDWLREGGTITSGDNVQAALTSFERTIRNLVDTELIGSQQVDIWIDKSNNDRMYVLVVVNADVAKKIMEDAKKAVRASKEIRANLAAGIEAEKAFEKLDQLIDKQIERSAAVAK